jgi:hypothetical protein
MSAYTKFLFKILIILITFLSVSICYSKDRKKEWFIVGGTGDPEGLNTIFDEGLLQMLNFSGTMEWKKTLAFDGGHAGTEKILATPDKNIQSAVPFLGTTYNNMFKELIKKIKNKKLVAGDQILLTIDGHGTLKTNDQETHSVAIGMGTIENFKNFKNVGRVSLDRLKELSDLAVKNKIKFAIIDLSCFSGNTLNIQNENICIISASGKEEYGIVGLGSFAYKFLGQFEKGKNLEEIYLNARASSAGYNDFPMISTPAGREVNERIYAAISHYLHVDKQNSHDLLAEYDLKNRENFENNTCTSRQNYKDILDLLHDVRGQIKNVNEITAKVNDEALTGLYEALRKYRDYQLQYESALRGKFEAEIEIEKILNREFPEQKNLWRDYSLADLVYSDFLSQRKILTKLVEATKNPEELIKAENLVKELDQRQKMARYVKYLLSAQSKKKIDAYEKSLNNTDASFLATYHVSVEARKIYDILYKQNMTPTLKSNACRDFVL